MGLLQNSNAIPQLGGYNLTDSVRFRQSAGAYLERTLSTSSNRRTWTWSAWYKLGSNLANRDAMFSARSGNEQFNIYCGINIRVRAENSAGTVIGDIETSASYRDPSAWYHYVVVLDATNGTTADRCRVYINGERQTVLTGTSFSNTDFAINNSSLPHTIGKEATQTDYIDGYLTEVNFVDGQALTPSDFGETDATTGVWKPKKYTGTYGTNGFYLPMSEDEYISVEYLVVAGGGGAGGVSSDASGGGGGGGLLTSSTYLTPGSTYTVTVGAGGAGTTLTRGSAGGTSSLIGTGVSISTTGGGGGGYATGSGSGASSTGGNGGSGGGGGNPTASSGGTGISGQGYAGGNTYGGGGGAGGAGSTSTFSSTGNAGVGVNSSITGTSVGYAGGGNGGGSLGSTAYGSGKGEFNFATGTNTAGVANTGGGGGGRWHSGTVSGASGGSGVVILKVLTSEYTGTTTGSPTVTTSGSYTIIKFTSSGSYTA